MDEFETLLTASRIAVDRWLKAHIGNRADAEDVLQETCLAAFQGFPRLQNKASFLPWILGIARRKCADWYRAQAKSKTVLVDHLPDLIFLTGSHKHDIIHKTTISIRTIGSIII